MKGLGAVQNDLSAGGDLQGVGAVSAEGRGELGGVHRAGGGVEVSGVV